MQNNRKLRRTIFRAARELGNAGYRVSRCMGIGAQAFDLLATTVYAPAKDVGIDVKVAVDEISREALKAILAFPTHRKVELWILKSGPKPTAPGLWLIYRIEDGKIINQPRDWPIEKVKSTPTKRKATLRNSEAALPNGGVSSALSAGPEK